jgi:RNA polymerase sigma factor (sigma-70 family)
MSARLRRPVEGDGAVYGRLFREGRAEVLARIAREFPHVSPEDREDVVALALLEMVRGRRLRRWEPGAIGAWAELARRRMVDELRRVKRREQRARLEPLTDDVEVADPVTPHEQIEAALSDWRVVELMAQLTPRAAMFVKLRVLEGASRSDVIAATGWSTKQYEKAQAAAKKSLRATLGDLDSPRRCEPYRGLIDSGALRGDVDGREQAGLHAHLEACGSCRAYGGEAHRAVHGVAPLVGLLPASAAGGGALTGVGSSGLGVPAGVFAKGAAILCAGALCVGGAVMVLHRDEPQRRGEQRMVLHRDEPRRRGRLRANAPLMTALAPRSVARRPAGSQTAATRKSRHRARVDALGLAAAGTPNAGLRRASGSDLDPAPVRPPSEKAETAFGFGSVAQPPPVPAASCTPGELGC